ncbi:MAG: aerolysin family beta-barrel pore-forming toxin [Polyangiaceae bacterium]
MTHLAPHDIVRGSNQANGLCRRGRLGLSPFAGGAMLVAALLLPACVESIDPDAEDQMSEEGIPEKLMDGSDDEGDLGIASSALNSPVTLYEHSSYGGKSSSFASGVFDTGSLGAVGNDRVTSVKVPSGMTVKLYEHARYRGSSLKLTKDTTNVGSAFNDKTSSVAVYGSITESGSAIALSGVSNNATLKSKIANNPTLIKKLAYAADMLGFAWCGGTGSQYVGEDFSVYENADGSYSMQANYDPTDPYTSGYWADKRLKITLSDFSVEIDPATFTYGSPTTTVLAPLAVSQADAKNYSAQQSSVAVQLQDIHTDIYSHATNVSFTEGVKLTIKNKAKVPLFGESELSTEFSFSSTQGWTNTTTTQNVVGQLVTYTATVPPVSKKHITMYSYRTKSTINYTSVARVKFKVSFYGFLKWSGNGRNDHPENRPFITATFGTDSLSGLEHIVDMYDHANSPGYSQWDWDWVKANHYPWIGSTIGTLRKGVTAPLSGKFEGVKGLYVDVVEAAAQPL